MLPSTAVWRHRVLRDWMVPVFLAAFAAALVLHAGYRTLVAITRERENDQRTRVLIAEIAAQGFGESLRASLSNAADIALTPRRESQRLRQRLAALLRGADSLYACRCSAMLRPIGAFAVDGSGRVVEAAGGRFAIVDALVDSLVARTRRERTIPEGPHLLTGGTDGATWFLMVGGNNGHDRDGDAG